jgi:hypothetical protein
MKKTTRLTIESERVYIFRRHKAVRRARCDQCAAMVGFVTAEEATALLRINARTFYRRVEEGSVHFTETTDGSLLICLNSLGGDELPQSL